MNLITNYLRKQAAQQFIDRIDAGTDVYYVFVGKPEPFTSDSAPPQPNQTVQEVVIDAYADMIVGKRVTTGDVKLMVPRYDWVSNTVYDVYTHTDADLYTKQFYVVVNEGINHAVFKCIGNNNGNPSTIPPDVYATSPQDTVYETADGYQWKFLYNIPDSTFRKFATSKFIPVTPNANVTANAVSGSIDYLDVSYGGSNYNSHGSGVIQISAVNGDARVFQVEATKSANTDFFKNCALKITSGTGAGQQRLITDYVVSGSLRNVVIDRPFDVLPDVFSRYEISPAIIIAGDGSGFVGRGLVNTASSNSIYRVEITDSGIDYTYANVQIYANTGGVSNAAVITPIVSPPGGHGSDVASELGARHLGVSISLNSNDSDNDDRLIDENDYRMIGMIKNPAFANVNISYTNETQSFVDGDIIVQEDTGARGEVAAFTSTTLKLTNVTKFFATGNSTVNLIRSLSGAQAEVTAVSSPTTYIDQTYKLIVDNTSGQFQEDEVVYQGGNATGVMYYANTTVMRITKNRGVWNTSDDVVGIVETVSGRTSGQSAKITGLVVGDLVPRSGEIVYLETVKPIVRYPQQSETLKLILQF